MAKKTVKQSPVEKMADSKRKLIVRLNNEIKDVFAEAERRAEKIRGRIRIAEALKNALEKGTLKL
jgi:hypothetical protein